MNSLQRELLLLFVEGNNFAARRQAQISMSPQGNTQGIPETFGGNQTLSREEEVAFECHRALRTHLSLNLSVTW
jgi:hypothetical protein